MDNNTKFYMIAFYVITLFASNYGLEYEDYEECAPTIKCDANTKYRSFDGSCNNLITPWLGASKTPHLRLFDAHYSDGKYKFREQTNGDPLSNPREINLKVFFNKQSEDWNNHNILFMQWGQFVAHDITLLPADTSIGKKCCEMQNRKRVPAQCKAVIEVPEDDPIYVYRGQSCINFNRAETSSTYGCPLKQATFMVLSNHFIDGSHIYGTDKKLADSLRSFKNGLLKSEYYADPQEFCPQRNRTTWNCETSQSSALCFAAGDRRVNQNLGIALFQNMFLRFHNFIAKQLKEFNPSWNDETVYQETRKIVIAVIQHITYTQYLPILLGKTFLTRSGFFKETEYDENEDPSTAIEFSAGAFRVLHKQIPSVYRFIDEHGYERLRAIITDWMERPDLFQHYNNFDMLLRGCQETYTRADQPSYNPFVSSFLLLNTWPKFDGHDLMAADIQRGRDTGLAPYNKIRAACGLPEANTFDDLIDLISREDIENLQEVYSDVNDIDFIVGALLEKTPKGTKVGPTARCIIANSFYRYKVGDRFFYDVQGQPGSFTPAQLKTLKTINFGHVICATSNLEYLPKDIFKPIKERFNTKKYSCDTFKLNLEAWEDKTD